MGAENEQFTPSENISPLDVAKIKEQFDVDLMDFENVKDRIIMTVSGSQKPETADMAAVRPYKTIEDMTFFYSVTVSQAHDELLLIPVTNEVLREWQITPDDFIKFADQTVPLTHPYTFQGMSEVLADSLGVTSEELTDGKPEVMFVVTNDLRCKGAGVLGYPGIFDEISDKLGGSFFVLPSSIHEFLAVADNGQFKPEHMEDMVEDVNSSVVAPKDRLTDHAYHYDAQAKLFEEVHEYDNRKEHEAAKKDKTEIENNDEQQIVRRHRGR